MKNAWKYAVAVISLSSLSMLVGCGDQPGGSSILMPEVRGPESSAGGARAERGRTSPGAASSNTNPTPIAVPLGTINYVPNSTLLVSVSPMPYSGFTLSEARTRSGVPGLKGTDLVTLPGGSRMSVNSYMSKLGSWERLLTAKGTTLRDSRATIAREAVRTNVTELSNAATSIRAAHRDLGVPTGSVDDHVDDAASIVSGPIRNDFAVSTARLQATAAGKTAGSYSRTEDWDFTEGDDDGFSVYLRGQLSTEVSLSGAEVRGESQAGGTILGKNITVASAEGSILAPATGDPSVSLDLVLAGQSVDLSETLNTPSWAPDALSLSDEASRSMDYDASFSWPVCGIINVTGTIGAAGEAGFQYSVLVDQLSADASFEATANIEVYGEIGAAINLGFSIGSVEVSIAELSGGLGSSLTLIEDTVQFSANVNVDMTGLWSDWSIDYSLSGSNDMTLLKGEFYVWAEADFSWPFNWADHRWEETLFEWDGVTVNNDLFNIEGSIPLFQ